MSKAKTSKQIISVIAKIILIVFILLLMLISIVVILNIFANIAYDAYTDPDPGDDIFGNAVWIWFAIVVAFFVIPHFVSLVILLHSGLYSLQLTPFSKAKCLLPKPGFVSLLETAVVKSWEQASMSKIAAP